MAGAPTSIGLHRASRCYYNGNNMIELKVRKFGNSLGVILPKELIRRLKADEGKNILVVESSDGTLQLEPSDAEFEEQMKIARDGMARYRNTLRALAK